MSGVHFSAIEVLGYRALAQGDPVEFDCQPAEQDGYRLVATRVRKLQLEGLDRG
jgi:cold shock CspA family protein